MDEILIILGLILLNGVFSMAEIALVSARKARLETMAAKGDEKAKAALKLSLHPDMFLSTVQIGITLIGIMTGIFSGQELKGPIVDWLNTFPSLQQYSNGIATTIIIIIITYFSLVLGELLPKRIGLSAPEKIAKAVAKPMRIVSVITHPFVWLLSKSTHLLSRIIGVKDNDSQVTEEEIKAIISEGTEHGAIEEAEQEIIERVFHLGDRNITSLMTHRNDIVWVDSKATVADIKTIMGEKAHSVYPVCDGTIDNLKGVVFLKDMFMAEKETHAEDLAKKGSFVPENISAYQLLERFKEEKSHYAFIVDEYGTIKGLVTFNDVLEAIVGEVAPADAEDLEIIEREDGTYLVDAQISFYNFLTYFESEDMLSQESQNFDTLAGFIIHQLQKIPETGEHFEWKRFKFEIIDMDNHRIDKVLVTYSEQTEEQDGEADV